MVTLEKGNAFHYQVNEQERKRQDRCRSGLHVEAGKHERQTENDAGIDRHEQM